ncbi:MAG: RsmE family RNA methyltransferase [Bacteroidetes bacterium OLB12]|nr:MAG: RsmE family RNA methyltransferase [Bacteroidetes bacterium OLB12]HNR74160.1 16S rRNA (uracil(1498)-N(3))-methyltransferase [Cyclobacteriaceae bacterium]HNU42106.1 16S rRNA (uracil(1498)-N(3))-methyltransferase [Cyclobacteriaceae bacterium]
MNLFYQPAIPEGVFHLDEDESRHAVKVLRMQVGDPLHVTDGRGGYYKAAVTTADARKCTFTIQETNTTPPRSFFITLAIAPTKNIDRMEWLVEKAVEIGVEEIYFMVCQNSERKTINRERLLKIAVSAMKQSGQFRLPLLHDIKPFAEIVSGNANQKFICYVDASNPHLLKTQAQPNQHYLVLIGPEGDFRPTELDLALQNGFSKVSLGSTRLRTETAALTACQTLNFINL